MAVSVAALDIVDDDDSTVVFACTDEAGANAYGVKTFVRDLKVGRLRRENSVFEPTAGQGGSTPFSRDALVPMSWEQVFLEAPTHDQLQAAMNAFQAALAQGGHVRLTVRGSTVTRFYDFERPDDLPNLFGDDDADSFRAVSSLSYPAGIHVQLLRWPWRRLAELDPALNVLDNATLLIDTNLDGRPDGVSWVSASNISAESIDAATNSYTFTIATTANRTLRHTTKTAAVGQQWTFSGYAFAGDAVTAKLQLVIEFLDGGGSVIGGGTTSSTLVVLGVRELRYSVTSAAAPSGTASVRASWQLVNASATAVVVHFRKAQLENVTGLPNQAPTTFRVPAQTVPNDPASAGGLVFPFYNEGKAPAPVILEVKPDAGKVTEVLWARRGERGITGHNRLADLVNAAKVLQCESGTMGTDTSSVSDTNASGGNAAEVSGSGSSIGTMTRRVRLAATTQLEARRGVWDAVLRCKAMAASQHHLQVRYGPGTTDPAPYTLAEILHDVSSVSTFDYVLLPLGRFWVPDPKTALSQLTFDLYQRRDSGTGAFRFDYLWPLFADADILLTQSRIMAQNQATESWLATALVTPTNPGGLTAGSINTQNQLVLSATNNAGGTPPAAGQALGVARHIFRMNGTLMQNGGAGTKLGELRIRNITDSTDVLKIDLVPTVGQRWTDSTWIISFDSAAGKSYEAQVVFTATTTTGWKIFINFMDHQVFPYAAAGEYVRTDPLRRLPDGTIDGVVEHLDSSKQAIDTWGARGGIPAWAEPGLNLFQIGVNDVPDTGYLVNHNQLSRAPLVAARYAPREYE